MRISENVRGTIIVGGEECEEYGYTLSGGGHHATCWVASQAGKKYEVRVEDIPRASFYYEVVVDGNLVSATKVVPSEVDHRLNWLVVGKRISETKRRPLMFTPVSKTDDEAALLDLPQDIGDITIRAWRTEYTKERRKASFKYDFDAPQPPRAFHERLKKGIDHQTTYGNAFHDRKRMDPVRWRTRRRIGEPMELTFKYRPLAVLQANGIAPRPPPPAPVDSIDSDDEVIIIEPDVKPVKREKKGRAVVASQSQDIKPRIKKETAERRVKREAEVIDLTWML
ncbi:hypothetical protein CYLTODRAFT_494242 [Cylindrobasidium torrendii FP15055 ss-10]|uniref:DUF7918 domain-containing protein n=1 Tax=Cylindrobasidium torrendii FP15055 ss-10 TaxID=1314674 RepID=A0A0D7AXR0_9AGAR|nr:hypothetical protein CYLTODRAFT_494242 [Cylindrobasidium torrendii FP15055 ss-10]